MLSQRNNVVEKRRPNASGNGRLQHNMRTVDRCVPNVLRSSSHFGTAKSSAHPLRRCWPDRCVGRTLTQDSTSPVAIEPTKRTSPMGRVIAVATASSFRYPTDRDRDCLPGPPADRLTWHHWKCTVNGLMNILSACKNGVHSRGCSRVSVCSTPALRRSVMKAIGSTASARKWTPAWTPFLSETMRATVASASPWIQ